MTTPLFTVIIPTRNRKDILLRCVQSVLGGRMQPDQILVVDNASTDGTAARIRALARWEPRVRLLRWKKNNVAAARNRGARAARTAWLAFLDDDCVAPPGWLEKAARLVRKYQGRPIVFGGDYLPPGAPVPSGRGADRPRRLAPGHYLREGNLFLLRQTYLSHGGMNPALGPGEARFGYHEGMDLQIRIEQHDAKDSPRILSRELAVHHHQRPKNPLTCAFLAGYDLGRLQVGRQGVDPFYFFSRTVVISLRLAARCLTEGVGEGTCRDLVRIGKMLGALRPLSHKTPLRISQR